MVQGGRTAVSETVLRRISIHYLIAALVLGELAFVASLILAGRLMALADVYDALVFRRVYKPAVSHRETREIIISDRGRHFDPAVVDVFLEIEDTFYVHDPQTLDWTHPV